MKNYTEEEMNLINSLIEPVDIKDMSLVDSIVDKMLENKDYLELINFLISLHDFTEAPINIVNKLIESDNKECISVFLEHESILYFLTDEEKNQLKEYLNAYEVNIVLDEPYDYYYNLLLEHGVRPWKEEKIKDNIIEHTFTRYDKQINLRLKETEEAEVIASCVIYSNYNLPVEEQVSKIVDYINQFGFNIKKN